MANMDQIIPDEDPMWTEIYDNLKICSHTVLNGSYPNDDHLYCNATFDGYTCWNYTRAGVRTYGKCPRFMITHFGQSSGQPFKDCNADGTWFRHTETNEPWTDYSQCGNTERVQRASTVLYVYFSGYGLSIIALIISLFIFTCYRQLRCTRVTIHIHLFLSYVLTGVMWITYYGTTSFNLDALVENPIWCRVLHVLAQYMTICNYAWMLCEGFYLHTLLVVTFSNEKALLQICCLVGWGLPIIPSVIYSGLRSTDNGPQLNCWHDYTYLIWILEGPVILSLFINFIFLINILRILCSKVHSASQSEPNPFRQSFRATLTLIPLLGIHYFVLPFRPKTADENGQFVYDIISAIMSSYQGLLVALIFCFFNGEVLFLFRNGSSIYRRNSSRSDLGKDYAYSSVNKKINQTKVKRQIQSLDHHKVHCKSALPEIKTEEHASSKYQEITQV